MRLREKIYRLPVIIVAVIACIVMAVCFLTDPKEDLEEMQTYTDGTVFHYQGKDYDIAERSLAYSIFEYIELEPYILIVGSAGKNADYYGVFNTETLSFERDLYASRLIYRDGDLRTMVYFFEDEIFDYDGNIIKTCDLENGERIRDISFDENGTQLNIPILGWTREWRKSDEGLFSKWFWETSWQG